MTDDEMIQAIEKLKEEKRYEVLMTMSAYLEGDITKQDMRECRDARLFENRD